jgi:YHS domain-containing protein
MFSAAIVFAQSGQADTGKATTANAGVEKTKQLKAQTTCPVMGEPIDTTKYVDYKDKRIYVCCSNCIEKVKKNPEKYIKKLERMGQSVKVIGPAGKNENKVTSADSSMKGMDMKGMKMPGDTVAKSANAGYWTCPMHPEIHQSTSGKCPICGMNLVFKKSDKDTAQMKGMDHSKMKMDPK